MKERKIQAVFLDRDGTIGGSDRIEYPGEFQPYRGVKESIAALKSVGVRVFGLTNQPGIAAGKSTVAAFVEELEGIGMDGVYVCPHAAVDGCACRKPKPGMLLAAAAEYNLDLTRCAVVGDRSTDMEAAMAVAALPLLVLTGAGADTLSKQDVGGRAKIHVAADLNEACAWVMCVNNESSGCRTVADSRLIR